MLIIKIFNNIIETIKDALKQSAELRVMSDKIQQPDVETIPIEDDNMKLANLLANRDLVIGDPIYNDRTPTQHTSVISISKNKRKRSRKKKTAKTS